ncbi:MAG: hypothetical protein ACXVC7_07975 [Bacteroidia bacterium]
MITTSTSTLHLNEKQESEGEQFSVSDSPSKQTLDFILNYSKNLQVNKSRFVKEIEIIKS